MNVLAEIGGWVQTPAVQAVLAFWAVAAGAILLPLKVWLFPARQNARMLAYTGRTRRIVTPERFGIPGLEVFVNGKKQSYVSVSKIVIWNHGLTTIRPPDIAATDPLRIVLSQGTNVLSSDVLDVTRGACQVRLERRGRSQELLLHFDFLAHQDGAVIRLVHDGKPGAAQMKLVGTLIEGDGVRHVSADGASNVEGDDGFLHFRSSKYRDKFVMSALVLLVFSIPIQFEMIPKTWSVVMAPLLVASLLLTRRLLRIRWRRVHPHIPAKFVDQFSFSTFDDPTEPYKSNLMPSESISEGVSPALRP